MTIKDFRDVIGGGLLILAGAAAAVAATGYGIGSPGSIEPGFFPLLLCGVLVLVGAGIVWSGIDTTGNAPRAEAVRLNPWHLWCLCVVASGFILFGLLLPVAGLFLTCFVSISVVGATSRLLKPLGALVTAFVLAVVAVVLFRYLLDLQVPAWPWGG
ncbi:MAG TPA: tripartite tricarboxylate transporter TctB family protein [Paracoccus sp. (in: a-proteobacteria)]|uniref:tripartite tricarboxylate transporter TctB family protein n=1 Tax=Paracoccus sp. TaxID=267 RepID=UPI002C121F5D|nr:tripartite tricarboxylate transporter TctB family protein [Paracoccus sp. (in: a-proteobacteria)]HWL58971.1 tripartite tricarboxylate transporter TctB family protein [Paracoccus sp. (in: a-proteobacteria)]